MSCDLRAKDTYGASNNDSSCKQRAASDQRFGLFFMVIPVYLFVLSERNNGTVINIATITGRMSSRINETKPYIKSYPESEECSCKITFAVKDLIKMF